MDKRLLKEVDAAKYLGVSAVFLRKSRCKAMEDSGSLVPPYIKVGSRAIRYAVDDLDAFIEKNRRFVA